MPGGRRGNADARSVAGGQKVEGVGLARPAWNLPESSAPHAPATRRRRMVPNGVRLRPFDQPAWPGAITAARIQKTWNTDGITPSPTFLVVRHVLVTGSKRNQLHDYDDTTKNRTVPRLSEPVGGKDVCAGSGLGDRHGGTLGRHPVDHDRRVFVRRTACSGQHGRNRPLTLKGAKAAAQYRVCARIGIAREPTCGGSGRFHRSHDRGGPPTRFASPSTGMSATRAWTSDRTRPRPATAARWSSFESMLRTGTRVGFAPPRRWTLLTYRTLPRLSQGATRKGGRT
jgi:hypothetical protein